MGFFDFVRGGGKQEEKASQPEDFGSIKMDKPLKLESMDEAIPLVYVQRTSGDGKLLHLDNDYSSLTDDVLSITSNNAATNLLNLSTTYGSSSLTINQQCRMTMHTHGNAGEANINFTYFNTSAYDTSGARAS